METVPIALNREPSALSAIDDEINLVGAATYLRFDPIAALYQFVVHVELKARFAAVAQNLSRPDVDAERLLKVTNEAPVQSVFTERTLLDRPEEIHAVSGARHSDVIPLLHISTVRSSAFIWPDDHRDEHDVTFAALKDRWRADRDLAGDHISRRYAKRDEPLNLSSLRRTQQCDDAYGASYQVRVEQYRFDFVDDSLCFRVVYISVAEAAFDEERNAGTLSITMNTPMLRRAPRSSELVSLPAISLLFRKAGRLRWKKEG